MVNYGLMQLIAYGAQDIFLDPVTNGHTTTFFQKLEKERLDKFNSVCIVFKWKDRHEFGKEYDSYCSICQDDYESSEELRELPCGHAFGNECISDWFKTGSNTCPYCRSEVC